jgi:hypothetical protein
VKASFSHALKTATFAGGKQEFLLAKRAFLPRKSLPRPPKRGRPSLVFLPSNQRFQRLTMDFPSESAPFDKLKGRLLRPLRGASGRGLGEHPFPPRSATGGGGFGSSGHKRLGFDDDPAIITGTSGKGKIFRYLQIT